MGISRSLGSRCSSSRPHPSYSFVNQPTCSEAQSSSYQPNNQDCWSFVSNQRPERHATEWLSNNIRENNHNRNKPIFSYGAITGDCFGFRNRLRSRVAVGTSRHSIPFRSPYWTCGRRRASRKADEAAFWAVLHPHRSADGIGHPNAIFFRPRWISWPIDSASVTFPILLVSLPFAQLY